MLQMRKARAAIMLAQICALTIPAAASARGLMVIDERTTMRREPPPHGAIGTSTAYRISDAVPGRTMEFRKRVLHPGAAIGAHVIAHDEVYYVLSGTGEVTSGSESRVLTAGTAAYLFRGETVGIRQTGKASLTLIISYPLPVPAAVPAK